MSSNDHARSPSLSSSLSLSSIAYGCLPFIGLPSSWRTNGKRVKQSMFSFNPSKMNRQDHHLLQRQKHMGGYNTDCVSDENADKGDMYNQTKRKETEISTTSTITSWNDNEQSYQDNKMDCSERNLYMNHNTTHTSSTLEATTSSTTSTSTNFKTVSPMKFNQVGSNLERAKRDESKSKISANCLTNDSKQIIRTIGSIYTQLSISGSVSSIFPSNNNNNDDVVGSQFTHMPDDPLPFCGPTVPKISLIHYLTRLVILISQTLNPEESKVDIDSAGIRCLIMGHIYIERLLQLNPAFIITEKNIHRLMLMVMIISVSYTEDITPKMYMYSKIAGLSENQISSMQYILLNMMQYKLFINQDNYKAAFQNISLAAGVSIDNVNTILNKSVWMNTY